MAAITDPEAIRFVNEVIRPLCEEARSFNVRVNAAKTTWELGINAAFGNNADTVEDGRESEGVSRLTALHVNQAYGELIETLTMNEQIIARPCVRMIP